MIDPWANARIDFDDPVSVKTIAFDVVDDKVQVSVVGPSGLLRTLTVQIQNIELAQLRTEVRDALSFIAGDCEAYIPGWHQEYPHMRALVEDGS